MKRKILIQPLKREIEDAKEAADLAKRVFEEFNETSFDFRGKAIEIFYVKTGYRTYLEEKDDQFFFKAVDENTNPKKMVGMCGVYKKEGKIHLRSFFVDKEYQGQGLGRKLYEACLKEIKKRFGVTEIYVNSVKGAIQIYERFGFTKIGELNRSDNGFLHQLMIQKLEK